MPRELHRLPRVTERTGLSRAELYKRIKDGTFPKPIQIGARAVAWDSEEIDGWIEARIEAGKAVRGLK